MSDKNTYSIAKTATKAAPPLLVLLLVPAAKALLSAAGITMDDQQLYTIALSSYGGIIALLNWIKNRKKGKIV